MLITRDLYLQRLIARMHNGLIKVITGIRRSGKSYLLFKIFRQHLLDCGVPQDHIIGLELDRFENEQFRDPYHMMAYLKERIVDKKTYYVLIDEVQMLGRFTEVLNSLLHYENVDVYVTGSNSKFLSTDILTEFRGRGDEVHVFPLAFSEFVQVFDGDIRDGWMRYATFGGLPQAVLLKVLAILVGLVSAPIDEATTLMTSSNSCVLLMPLRSTISLR